ncbi:MAG: hypothetical protein IIX56_04965 [Treponema sp.]|nr:hypothetical protein [Treponema sp.]MBQ2234720.1 hypothetical protein [Treponema sp.]
MIFEITNNDDFVNSLITSKEKEIFREINKYISTIEEYLIDIYDNDAAKYSNLEISTYKTLFDVRLIKSDVTKKVRLIYIAKEILPFSFELVIEKSEIHVNSVNLQEEIEMDSFFPEISSFEKTILISYILNIENGYYEIKDSCFFKYCKSTFQNKMMYHFLMYYQHIYKERISGKKIVIKPINESVKDNIMVLGNLYLHLLAVQTSMKEIHLFCDKNNFYDAILEVNKILEELIILRGDYFIYEFLRYKEYYYIFNDYFCSLVTSLTKLKLKISHMDGSINKFLDKIVLISYKDQFIETEKLLNNILFYSSLLIIYVSPFFKTQWRFYSKVLFNKMHFILDDCSIQKIDFQTKELSGIPEERKSINGSTRLQIFFRLDGNYDRYLLRLDFSHQDVPYLHFNLEETMTGSMTSSGIPLKKTEVYNISDNGFCKFFYLCADKYWFRYNFESNYASYEGDDKIRIKELFNKQKHYRLFINNEQEFMNFLNELSNIQRLYLPRSFYELSFNNDKIANSVYLRKIKHKDDLIIEFNKLFKDKDALDDIPLDSNVLDEILNVLNNFYL